jgi:hypothetical protein
MDTLEEENAKNVVSAPVQDSTKRWCVVADYDADHDFYITRDPIQKFNSDGQISARNAELVELINLVQKKLRWMQVQYSDDRTATENAYAAYSICMMAKKLADTVDDKMNGAGETP